MLHSTCRSNLFYVISTNIGTDYCECQSKNIAFYNKIEVNLPMLIRQFIYALNSSFNIASLIVPIFALKKQRVMV